jgi:hypothetical protein
MNPEREVLWLARIYESNATSDILNIKFAKPHTKKEFEIIADAPDKSKEFSDWFDKLVQGGIIIFSEKIKRGRDKNIPANGYVVNVMDILKYIKNNSDLQDAWDTIRKFANRDKIG